MLRIIECKECKQTFKYEFNIDELRGGRKKYCDKCLKIKKLIATRESQRAYIHREYKIKKSTEPITKKVVIRNAIRHVLDLNKYMNTEESNSKIYDKVLQILPDKYVTRDALRRHYREVTLRNEV